MLDEGKIFQLLRVNKKQNQLEIIKEDISKLEKLLINENCKKASDNIFYENEIYNYFDEMVVKHLNLFVKNNNIDIQSPDFGNANFKLIFLTLESLISKIIHNAFFKCSVNEYKLGNGNNINTNNMSNSGNNNNINSTSNNSNYVNSSNDIEMDSNLTNNIFVATKLYKIDQIFEIKCDKFSFLKLNNLNLNIENNYIFYDKKTKSKKYSNNFLKIFKSFIIYSII